MRFSLRDLLLAMMFFGLAAFRVGEIDRFRHAAIAARAHGQFVCGTCAPGPIPIVLAIAAGVAALNGRYVFAALIGVFTALWLAVGAFT